MVYLSTMPSRPKLLIDPDALRSRRLRAFLTVQDLASKAKVSVGTIKALESPTPRGVTVDTLGRLATVLDCQRSDISRVESPESAAPSPDGVRA